MAHVVGTPSILVVEHDPEIAAPIVEQLVADGYSAALAHSARHARALAAISAPALVVLGRLDSPSAALDLLCEIRGEHDPWGRHLPVIVLGSSASHLDLLRAFSLGADDFLARPHESGDGEVGLCYLELRARLQSLLRRAAHARQSPSSPLCVGPLLIDTGSRAVLLHDRPISLRPREYALLLHLARQPTRVFSRHDLLRALWGFQGSSCTRTLDSHASRLRHKLAHHASEPWVINVRGVGYRLTT
jgi:DNA-binding response OmpR family regulator